MKIYCLSHSQIPSYYANAVHIMQMSSAFAQLGHSVTLFAKQGKNDVPDDFEYYGVSPSFKIIKFPLSAFKLIAKFQFVFSVLNQLKKMEKPDLFHVMHVYLLPFITRHRMPAIFEAHGAPSGLVERLILRRFLQKHPLTRLATNTNALKRHFLTLYPFLSENDITAAPNGVPIAIDAHLDRFSQSADTVSHLKCGYAGGLYRGRGIEVIIELAKIFPDIDFHIAGGSGEEVSFWAAKAPYLRNLFFEGFIQPQKIYEFLRRMDILLAPYQNRVSVAGNTGNTVNWMSPMKVFDYMAAGKPIIASDLPVMHEILKHEFTALLVKPDSIKDWADAVRRLQSKSLRQQLSQQAKQECLEKYTWSDRAKKILADFMGG